MGIRNWLVFFWGGVKKNCFFKLRWGSHPTPKPALPKVPISGINTNKQHRERRLWNRICWLWWRSLLIGNDHNYRKQLWNQSVEHNSQSAAEKAIPTLWLAESVRMAIYRDARNLLINNAAKWRKYMRYKK